MTSQITEYLHWFNKREGAPRSLVGLITLLIVTDSPAPPALRHFEAGRTDALDDTPNGRYFAGHAQTAMRGDAWKSFAA